MSISPLNVFSSLMKTACMIRVRGSIYARYYALSLDRLSATADFTRTRCAFYILALLYILSNSTLTILGSGRSRARVPIHFAAIFS
jgi:hypothetical protein